MEDYLFFLKFFSQLFYIHFYVVQKIKMPLMALSYDNHIYFTKSEKHHSYHYMLNIHYTWTTEHGCNNWEASCMCW